MWWAAAVLGWEYGPQAKRLIPGCSLICLCSSSSCLHLPGSIAVYPCLLPAGPLPDGTNTCLGLLASILHREWASTVGNLVPRPYIMIITVLGGTRREGGAQTAHS